MAKKKQTLLHKSSQMAQEPETHPNTENAPLSAAAEPAAAVDTVPLVEDTAEKISNLKSLNEMLVNETAKKRLEIGALLEDKKSLEAELTRSESEADSLRVELTRVGQELRRVEEEKVGLKEEKEGVEAEMARVVEERSVMEKMKCEGELEIGELKGVRDELRREIEEEKKRFASAVRDKEELNQAIAVKDGEVKGLEKRLSEVEAKGRSVVVELDGLKVKYENKVKVLGEREVEIEGSKAECVGLRKKIEGLSGEKDEVLKENAGLKKANEEQKERIGGLVEEADGLNEVLVSLREGEEKWRVKFLELEKSNAEVVRELDGLKSEFGALLEEKKAKEKEIEGLIGENSKNLKRLGELEKEIESVKQVNGEVLEEKKVLEGVKLRQEGKIRELQSEVNEIRGSVLSLQKSNKDELDRNVKLLSEVDDFKSALDRAVSERDDVKKALDEERKNGVELELKVSEISRNMEETAKVMEELRGATDAVVAEKKELESMYNKLFDEKVLAEKSAVKAKEKVAELEGTLRSKSDMFVSALGMLSNMAVQLSEKDGKKADDAIVVNERSMNGDMAPYMAELEAIRTVFRSREDKVEEMRQQVESLQCSVLDAKKQKKLWTLVSSATTILAAVVSFAYAARVR